MTPPEMETYDGQLPVLAENGVGMVRRFMDSWSDLAPLLKNLGKSSQTWVTGTLFAGVLSDYAGRFTRETGISVTVVPVTNHAFGETVTVAGLLTVGDIADALRDVEVGDQIVLPGEVFRGPDDKALDEKTVSDLAREIDRPIALATYENTGWKVVNSA